MVGPGPGRILDLNLGLLRRARRQGAGSGRHRPDARGAVVQRRGPELRQERAPACPPAFGAPSVVDRFAQTSPRVLLAVDGYAYGGKNFDRRPEVAAIAAQLPG